MDCHKYPDVIEYCNSVFLPKMERIRRQMARYKFVAHDQPLKYIPPQLEPGAKEVIMNF